MINYNSLTGGININGPSRYSAPIIQENNFIKVYVSKNNIEFHQHGKVIYKKPIPSISVAPIRREEKREEKREDSIFIDILNIFSDAQDIANAEKELIDNLTIKYILMGIT